MADMNVTESLREGYILDFISGLPVKETPEEIEAVQPFSKILVDDYGYPKEFVHTRPQYRVKVRPSDTKKEYPVDIAVFSSATHDEDSVYIKLKSILFPGSKRNAISCSARWPMLL